MPLEYKDRIAVTQKVFDHTDLIAETCTLNGKLCQCGQRLVRVEVTKKNPSRIEKLVPSRARRTITVCPNPNCPIR